MEPRSPTTLWPSRETAVSTPLPYGLAYLQADSTVVTSKEVFILAPVESCFGIVAKQLEQLPEWDPIMVDTQPLSENREQVGATSQVTLNLGGKKLGSPTLICRYRPNEAIGWVFKNEPKVSENWRLEAKPPGTWVCVTLAWEIPSLIERLLQKVMRWKKVEQNLDRMLAQLKETVENTKP